MTKSKTYLSKDSEHRLSDVGAALYLLSFARPWVLLGTVSTISIVLSGILVMVSARTIGVAVEDALHRRTWEAAAEWLWMVVILEGMAVLFLYLGRCGLTDLAGKTVRSIRSTLYRRLQILPSSYYDRTPLGRTVTRITHDVEGVEDFFAASVGRIGTSVVLIGTVVPAMLFSHLLLGSITVAAMLPCFLITRFGKNVGRGLNRTYASQNSAINARLSEYLNGIPVIRAFGLEEWSSTQMDHSINRWLGTGLQMNRVFSILRPLNSMAAQLPILVVLLYGGERVLSGTLGVGIVITFLRYCDQFSGPVIKLAQEIHQLQAAFASAERVAAMLQEPTEAAVLGADGIIVPETLQGTVAFTNVSLRYSPSTPWALRDVSFSVPAGHRIGLAGKTGSGKSSTVSLIARLYPPTEGTILIDSTPIENYQRSGLRRTIGFVTQDPTIFAGTVMENLAPGGIRSRETVLHAAEQTGLLATLERKGATLDALVVDGGLNFSSGERQLIALTRIILQNPSIIIMDEATATIDEELERTIHAALDRLMANRTTFIIAHRINTLLSCDTILVFQEGRIVESGSHQELLHENGYYAELFRKAEAGSLEAS